MPTTSRSRRNGAVIGAVAPFALTPDAQNPSAEQILALRAIAPEMGRPFLSLYKLYLLEDPSLPTSLPRYTFADKMRLGLSLFSEADQARLALDFVSLLLPDIEKAFPNDPRWRATLQLAYGWIDTKENREEGDVHPFDVMKILHPLYDAIGTPQPLPRSDADRSHRMRAFGRDCANILLNTLEHLFISKSNMPLQARAAAAGVERALFVKVLAIEGAYEYATSSKERTKLIEKELLDVIRARLRRLQGTTFVGAVSEEEEAKNPQTHPKRLTQLAEKFPQEVAQNPNTPPLVLDLLWWLYPAAVEENPALSLLSLEDPTGEWRSFTQEKIEEIEEIAKHEMSWDGFYEGDFNTSHFWDPGFANRYGHDIVISLRRGDDLRERIRDAWDEQRPDEGPDTIDEDDLTFIVNTLLSYIADEDRAAEEAMKYAERALDAVKELDLETASSEANEAKRLAMDYSGAYRDLCDAIDWQFREQAQERLSELAETTVVGRKRIPKKKSLGRRQSNVGGSSLLPKELQGLPLWEINQRNALRWTPSQYRRALVDPNLDPTEALIVFKSMLLRLPPSVVESNQLGPLLLQNPAWPLWLLENPNYQKEAMVVARLCAHDAVALLFAQPNTSSVGGTSVWTTIYNEKMKPTDIFKNPRFSTLRKEIGEKGAVRALIAGEDLYAWDGRDAIHNEVKRALLLPESSIPITLRFTSKPKEVELALGWNQDLPHRIDWASLPYFAKQQIQVNDLTDYTAFPFESIKGVLPSQTLPRRKR